MWAKLSFVPSQSTRLTYRQTDGQKGLGNTVRCIAYSRAVKTDKEEDIHLLVYSTLVQLEVVEQICHRPD